MQQLTAFAGLGLAAYGLALEREPFFAVVSGPVPGGIAAAFTPAEVHDYIEKENNQKWTHENWMPMRERIKWANPDFDYSSDYDYNEQYLTRFWEFATCDWAEYDKWD